MSNTMEIEEPCIYCGRMVMQNEIHTSECRMSTGLFPYEREEMPHGLRCCSCRILIVEGDHYVRGPYPSDAPQFPIEGVDAKGLYCVGCGAMESVA